VNPVVQDEAMNDKAIRWFLAAIGIFYLLNFLGLLPARSAAVLMLMYPSVGNGFQGELMMLLQDAWLVVGMQLGAVGVLALWALREPIRYAGIIPVVVFIEIFDAMWDVYSMVLSSETLWFGLTTLAIHLVWIIWGISLWRQVGDRLSQPRAVDAERN
jgi:hypothetical protein